MTRDGLRSDLRRLLGEAALVDCDEQTGYERGHRYGAGRAAAVVRPASSLEVAAIMRYCHAQGLGVVVQGANTGLVAASTPDATGEQIVVSTDRLRGIYGLDAAERTATCGAGTRLSELNRAAEIHHLSFPIDLGADPSLGGMVATNTGGSRLIRYGDVRRNLLGLEVVLADADGTLLSNLRGLRKNSTGLDFKQLFVGTGGALGIVTQVQVELHRLPRQSSNALIVPASIEVIPAIVAQLEGDLGELLAAIEGMSGNAFQAALHHQTALHDPFAGDAKPEYLLLVEAATSLGPSSGLDIDEVLLAALMRLLEGEAPLAGDVRMGRGADFWHIRHAISEGVKAQGKVIAFDISAPRSGLAALRRDLTALVEAFRDDLRIFDFGHIGDGGIHFNLALPHDAAISEAETARLREIVYDCVVRGHGGSYSAEHAIGPYNLEFYRRYTDPAARKVAGDIARLLNPGGTLGAFGLGGG